MRARSAVGLSGFGLLVSFSVADEVEFEEESLCFRSALSSLASPLLVGLGRSLNPEKSVPKEPACPMAILIIVVVDSTTADVVTTGMKLVTTAFYIVSLLLRCACNGYIENLLVQSLQ